MTKSAVLPAHVDVVEIDAMDLSEWENGQSTPQASDVNLAELVRRTTELPAVAAPDGESAASSAAQDRVRRKTATLVPTRRPPAGPAVPPPVARAATMVGLPVSVQRAPALTRAPATEAATATGERAESRLPVLTAAGDLEVTVPVMFITSAGGTVKVEPLPRVEPATTALAQRSRIGPGRRSSPAGEPNPAWPPGPIPSERSSHSDRLAASDRVPRGTGHEAEGADQLSVMLTRRRLLWIAGGFAVLLIGAVVATTLLAGAGAGAGPAPGEGRAPSVSQPASAAAPAASSGVPSATAGRPVSQPRAATSEVPTERSAAPGPDQPVATAAPASPASPAPPASRSRPIRHHAKRIAGKDLVVDYTVRSSDAPPPSLLAQSEEDPAIGRARAAYIDGNQKLFAGDSDGAIRAYHQALEIYPGYVGGYRGLGLAYAQAGDDARALSALRTYVASVPNARDATLIKKRIARLQGK